MQNTIKKLFKNHLTWLDIVICVLLSFIIPSSNSFLSNGQVNYDFLFILQIFLTFFLLIISIIFVRRFLYCLAHKIPKKTNRFMNFINKFLNSKHNLLWIALIIFIFWIPTLIMLYPGTIINDTWDQLLQVQNLQNNVWSFNSHHPVFDSIIMGTIIIPISNLFHNWHIGFFFYVLLQAIFTSLTFSYSIVYMKNKFKQSNLVSLIILLFYCLLPIYAASVQTISKDALSAWIFLLFIINFIEIIRTKSAVLKSKKFLLTFLIICILCILTKKVEVYVILISLFSILLFQKGSRKQLLVVISSLLFISLSIIPSLQETFNIEPSGTQELLSVPFQQTARYVKEHPDEVTESEKEVIDKVLNYDELSTSYNPTNADPIKGYFPRGEDSDYKKYLKVWARQGLRQPSSYLSATSAHLAGWFSFSLYQPITNMEHHSQLNPNFIPESTASRNDFFSSTSKIFDTVYHSIYNIPIIGIILTFAFYATLIPLFIICTIFKQRKNFSPKYLLTCIPLLLSLVLGCYLAPVSADLEGVRYLYPITYSIPVYFMLLVYLSNPTKTKK